MFQEMVRNGRGGQDKLKCKNEGKSPWNLCDSDRMFNWNFNLIDGDPIVENPFPELKLVYEIKFPHFECRSFLVSYSS